MPQHWERLSALRLDATAQRRHRTTTHCIKPVFHGGGAAMPQGTAALRLFCGAPTFLRRSDFFAALRLFCGAPAFLRRSDFFAALRLCT
jgi:hypothetical protein